MLSTLSSAVYSLWRDYIADPYNASSSASWPSSPFSSSRGTYSSLSSSSSSTSNQPAQSPITHDFLPYPRDVRLVRLLLHRGLGLPVELADLIIDAARYWPAAVGTSTSVGGVVLGGGAASGRGGQRVVGGKGVVRASDTQRHKAAQLVAVTGAVPGDDDDGGGGGGGSGGRGREWEGMRKVRVRCIRWWLRSRDQGWVREGVARKGTYIGSSSWFDACILRPLPPSDPRPPITPELATRIQQLLLRSGSSTSQSLPSSSSSDNTFPAFLVGNLLTHDPDDARLLLRALGWDFVERVERVEVDGEVGERRGVLWKLQANLVAGEAYRVHEGEWWKVGEERQREWGGDENEGRGDGAGFADVLRPGDRVGVWARAMLPGWVNDVDEVKVEVRYSV
ncbi:hypothetical protein B0J12DRAFT_777755 [Macrophomina phaseolina]|uniref:Uncharacterized protein n=1 Tax=Macrophomina phaseolina TaxID=35725 RepID=A0ABQ8GI25_9PEZI|nr:hypothetical protein B0J12DRAFT_777755 [Macrophomina phaseolina]